MHISDLRTLLEQNPDAPTAADPNAEVEASLVYLASSAALASLQVDAYWPKWDSPWWHMLVLCEMGLAKRIPEPAVEAMVAALERWPIKVFPALGDKPPAESDLMWEASCHCAVGSMYSILRACGVDVDARLPWMRPWLSSYQMADGGMSCDENAYEVEGECPSSMVALLPPFEALLFHAPNLSKDELTFLDRAAVFLLDRELRLGSSSVHNAAEREAAPRWLEPCFPRLYLYDVLRGLHALLAWAELRDRPLSIVSLEAVLESLAALAPDGQVRIARRSYEGVGSRRVPRQPGQPPERGPASLFPLLEATSRIGEVSPYLSARWSECKQRLRSLLERGAIRPASLVTLVPPNPEWADQAEEEARRIASVLGDNLVRVHHIGSTAIPGIQAKPILDLAPEVRDIEALDALEGEIKSAGYDYWGEYGLRGRRFCPRVDQDGERLANVHCYQSGDPELHRHLAFRDYMRAHPELAAEYEREKLRAQALHPHDVFAYNSAKNPWIRRKEREALEWASRR